MVETVYDMLSILQTLTMWEFPKKHHCTIAFAIRNGYEDGVERKTNGMYGFYTVFCIYANKPNGKCAAFI